MECRGVSFYVAELVFFIFKVGESMLEPSVRLFIYQAACESRVNRTTPCGEGAVQSVSAHYIVAYKLLLNAPAILLALFCGAWSDRVGRKLPVMLSSFGCVLAVLCYMFSMLASPPLLPLVLVGAAVRGAFGRSAVMTMALHSYVSDVTTRDQRTEKIGRLLAMNYFGYFAGSLAAGALLEVAGFNVVFCSVVVINCACVVCTLVFMKESVAGVKSLVPSDSSSSSGLVQDDDGDGDDDDDGISESRPQRRVTSSTKRHPFTAANVRASLAVLLDPRPQRGCCHLVVMLLVIVVQQTCKSGEVDVTLLFVERPPLSWRRSLYGYLLAADYACLGLAVSLLLPLLITHCRLHDMTLLLVGVAFKVLRLVLLAFAERSWLVFLSVVVSCPSAFIISGAKSMVSKLVGEDELGKAFSLLSCGETVSNLAGSVLFTSVYSATQDVAPPGLVFCLDAALFVVLFAALLLLSRDIKLAEQQRLLGGLTSGQVSLYGATDADQPDPPRDVRD